MTGDQPFLRATKRQSLRLFRRIARQFRRFCRKLLMPCTYERGQDPPGRSAFRGSGYCEQIIIRLAKQPTSQSAKSDIDIFVKCDDSI